MGKAMQGTSRLTQWDNVLVYKKLAARSAKSVLGANFARETHQRHPPPNNHVYFGFVLYITVEIIIQRNGTMLAAADALSQLHTSGQHR